MVHQSPLIYLLYLLHRYVLFLLNNIIWTILYLYFFLYILCKIFLSFSSSLSYLTVKQINGTIIILYFGPQLFHYSICFVFFNIMECNCQTNKFGWSYTYIWDHNNSINLFASFSSILRYLAFKQVNLNYFAFTGCSITLP